jgi:type I restriction enzyme, S subunit
MNVLPTGWERVELDDACELIRGITFPTAEKRFEYRVGMIGCLRTANVQTTVEWDDLWFVPRQYVKQAQQIVEVNDILISTANSYELVGKVSRVTHIKFDSTLGAFISLLRAHKGIDAGFLYYQMTSEAVQQAIREMSSTTTNISNVSGGKLKTLELVIAPVAEQTRIVEKLEELLTGLDAGVAELKAAQKKLAQYRQSLLKAAVEGALTAQWRANNKPAETGAQLLERILQERRARWEAKQLAKFKEQGKAPPKDWQKKYPEPVQPDTTDLPALPHGWVWSTLEQLTEFITSGSRGWADYYADAGATFIRSQNINKDRLDLADIAFVNPPVSAEGARTRVQKEDLLLTITGANVGKTARVDIEIDEAFVSQHVALLRTVDSSFSAYLHVFLITSAGGRGQLNKEAYGAGKPGLNLQQLSAVTVPLPSIQGIYELMKQVSKHLNSTTEQEFAIAASFKQSTAQRQNILKAAFSGQLVPQDPSDEPASQLLARIRAERAAQQAVKKPRGLKAKDVA